MKFIRIILFCVWVLSLSASAYAQKEYHRIVSLLPSITEILFAVGAGDDVVGVTKFCVYPPEVKTKAVVGGLLDTNYEIIYRLKPDLVILASEHIDHRGKFKDMGIEVLEIETRSVPSILQSIDQIGAKLNRIEEAAALKKTIQDKIDSIKAKTKDLPKPKVLVTFLRPVGEGEIRDVYVAGNFTYFNDLLEILGADNAYKGSKLITSPVLSAEGILRLDPDVIIETMSTLNESNLSISKALEDWDVLSSLKAYQNKRIYILTGSYVEVPGPRIVQILDDMARSIHPQINWN